MPEWRKAEVMCRTLMLGTLMFLAGCQGVVGPRQRLAQPIPIDDPRLPIEEQQARGRQRLAFPEESEDVAPRTFAELPATRGRY
jgi:hypothetical protein